MNWLQYETEKRKIAATSENAADYQEKIAELVKRLKL